MFLAPTYHHAALSDHGIIPIRKLVNAVVYMRAPRCFVDLFLCSVEVAVVNVMFNRIVKQRGILRYDANCATQGVETHVADVLAVD